jgi:N utilization substance protein B
MPVMDRSVLRLAVFELLHQPETPQPVVIDEALELAKQYSTPEAVKFINGVLEGVRKRLQPDEPSHI